MAQVKYLVTGKCFVNGGRYEPRPDGKPVYVMGPPGIAGKALEEVKPPPAPAAPEEKPAPAPVEEPKAPPAPPPAPAKPKG